MNNPLFTSLNPFLGEAKPKEGLSRHGEAFDRETVASRVGTIELADKILDAAFNGQTDIIGDAPQIPKAAINEYANRGGEYAIKAVITQPDQAKYPAESIEKVVIEQPSQTAVDHEAIARSEVDAALKELESLTEA